MANAFGLVLSIDGFTKGDIHSLCCILFVSIFTLWFIRARKPIRLGARINIKVMHRPILWAYGLIVNTLRFFLSLRV